MYDFSHLGLFVLTDVTPEQTQNYVHVLSLTSDHATGSDHIEGFAGA